MSTLNGQELEIFRAGNYGKKGTYTPQDLQQLAASYNPARHEVPIVLGHPESNAPAFGWVKKLRADGDLLFATLGDVHPVLDKAVGDKLYKKRSVAFFNRQGSGREIRHLAFLGAQPPEVAGLTDAAFSAEAFEEIEFGVGPQGEMDMAAEDQKQTIREALKEFFAQFSGVKPGGDPQIVDVGALEARLDAKFSAQLAEKDAKIEELSSQFSAEKTANASVVSARRLEGVIGTLKGNHKWIPAYDAMGVPQIFAALAASPNQEIEFSAVKDGEAPVKLDPVAAFSKFLEGLPKIVPAGQLFSGAPATAAAAPKGTVNADPASVQFHAAVETRAKEKSIPYNEALSQLRSEGMSNETFGSASTGEV